jgi:hypothetical protein
MGEFIPFRKCCSDYGSGEFRQNSPSAALGICGAIQCNGSDKSRMAPTHKVNNFLVMEFKPEPEGKYRLTKGF